MQNFPEMGKRFISRRERSGMRSSKDLTERWLIKPLERSRGAELLLIGFSIIDDGNAVLPEPNRACGAGRFAVRVEGF